ncbi:uncharacterized protein TRAVEDRAFT_52045 [Trametes versicolor FP-101664 SS1]|uniref:uncharacterized protein n=1 Tax=Trametes versicolor (strain FP-101664) TaxID=717944 RepID=UPI0004622B80|nr:uncharacterized protein TRAVEDRAFT_52045 [Trametes versicolor FP-101664 SS1]EIW54337.1 hypothetical protein TRAVEDRAFT_52045 [Trametes versicolor FP-101664 SS1]
MSFSTAVHAKMYPHAALATADILHEIFWHLRITDPADTYENSIAMGTLSRAARVNKAFCEPALRSLWWALPNGIDPVLMLLSWWDPYKTYFPLYEVDMEREFSISEWTRLITYASYVHFIHPSDSKPPPRPIPRSFLDFLHITQNGRPLFPNLHQFTWDTYTLHQTDLSLFAPTGLHKLTIHASDGPRDLHRRINGYFPKPFDFSDLEMALRELRGLRALDIRRFPGSSIHPTVLTLVVQLRWLQSLSIDPIYPVFDMVFLRKLSQFPVLRELDISVIPDWGAPLPDLAFRGFLTLRKLILRLHDRIMTVLPIFASPNLTSLFLESYARDASVIPKVLNLVAHTYRTLRSVTFEWPHAQKTHASHGLLDDFDAVFGNLLLIHTIEEFTLRTPRELVISTGGNASLALLAHSWPKLRVLSLYATLRGPLTHTVLVPFARSCPELRILHLRSVNFAHITRELLAGAAPRVLPHGLRELHICNALVSSASEHLAAELIRRLFPRARWDAPAWGLGRACCLYAGFRCDVVMGKLVPPTSVLREGPDFCMEYKRPSR